MEEYKFEYGIADAFATFKVDRKKFTAETAKATLGFFTWDYDEDNDPVDEVLKKYALAAIRSATFNNYNVYGVKMDFEDKEGYAPVDGSYGITLIHVEGYEFNEEELSLEKII